MTRCPNDAASSSPVPSLPVAGTVSDLRLEQKDGGFEITAVHLEVTARIPGGDRQLFETAANNAKAGCPVSKVLKAEITMDAEMVAS